MATAVRDKAFPGVKTQFLNLSNRRLCKGQPFLARNNKIGKILQDQRTRKSLGFTRTYLLVSRSIETEMCENKKRVKGKENKK